MSDNPLAETWQCHSCNRILNPDTLGTYSDGPVDDRGTRVDIHQCTWCKSTDVGDFGPAELVEELGRIAAAQVSAGLRLGPRIYRLHEIHRANIEQIQIILEGVLDL